MSLEDLALAIAIVWILAGLAIAIGVGRAISIHNAPPWDLSRRPDVLIRIQKRRAGMRNDRLGPHVRIIDAGGPPDKQPGSHNLGARRRH